MSTPEWVADARASYDSAADGYTELLRDALAERPAVRGVLALFAELVPGGPVADVGCGPGFCTAHLRGLGLDAFGVDVSPRMVRIARDTHPGTAFTVGSMAELALAEKSLGGLLAFSSVIHVPDEAMPGVLAGFHRVLRPGGVALLLFHVGDGSTLKTEGYGGHPMRVHVHRRSMDRMSAWLRDAGFDIDASLVLSPDADPPAGGVLIARRPAVSA